MANLVYKGNKANLPSSRNATSFYLVEDTRELYFGANLYTEAVRFFTATEQTPKPSNPAQGVLYVDLASGNGYAYNGTSWSTVITSANGIKGDLIGTSADAASADTIYGAKAYADAAVSAIQDGTSIDSFGDVETALGGKQDTIPENTYDAYGAAAAVLGESTDAASADTVYGAKAAAAAAQSTADAKVASVGATSNKGIEVGGTATAPTVGVKLSSKANNDLRFATGTGEDGGLYFHAQAAAEYTMVQQATAETGYAATYYLTKDNVQVGSKINIPKDFLVKSASIETVSTADVPYSGAQVGDKYIDFVINATDASETAQHLHLPVNDLVDVYTSGSQSGDMVVVAIDSSNRITATLSDGTVTLAKLASAVQTEIGKAHTHSNKELLDTYTQTEANIADAVSKKHAHSNGALLDTYTQTEVNLADAVSKKHEHSNKSELDLFATGDKSKLDTCYEAITVGSF